MKEIIKDLKDCIKSANDTHKIGIVISITDATKIVEALKSRLKWIPFNERKPRHSGNYYWRGKSSYGGLNHFDSFSGEFDFPDHIPVNKVADDYLEWLDEGEAEG